MLEKIKKHYLYFMMYAFIGWAYEIVLEVFIYKWGYFDRGVLSGPYCPVYGFGAIAFLLTVNRLLKNKPLKKKLLLIPVIFLSTMAIATTIELITSYLCEWTIGTWPWQTYHDYKYNFQGRIALSPSIRFGLGGVLFLYILQPIFDKMVGKLNKKWLTIVSCSVALMFIGDIIYTFLIL